MSELLISLLMAMYRALKVKLPDCPTLFTEIRKGKRKMKAQSRVYVLLCQLTAAALALRIAAYVLLVISIFNFLAHFVPRWPFVEFSANDGHDLYWAFVLSGAQPAHALHYCVVVAVGCVTMLIVFVLSLNSVAWIAARMVEEFFPLSISRAIK